MVKLSKVLWTEAKLAVDELAIQMLRQAQCTHHSLARQRINIEDVDATIALHHIFMVLQILFKERCQYDLVEAPMGNNSYMVARSPGKVCPRSCCLFPGFFAAERPVIAMAQVP